MENLFGEQVVQNALLRDKFMEPPFTVIDSKSGLWQARKKRWKALGIASHLGRDGVECNAKFDDEVDEKTGLNKYGRKPMEGVSIFDPVLCELMYRWFCPDGGTILDPFAGGSVRGIVANYLGYKYTGIDIRAEQVDSNREQGLKILPVNNQPQWYTGDSNVVLDDKWQYDFDMIFSCPPYADLEVYSDLTGDISNKTYPVAKLKTGGFAVFVVGDVRGRDGYYLDFIGDTKRAFIDAGAALYNDAVYLQPLGTAMLLANKIFGSGKKLIKVHENILIFKKA
jgi:hypothetical protein